ncbi:MAG: hypothetical protein B5M53_03585 [Candidatus Cloacimonas sp. 4484_209]|nr:MAG: hypothetical protein B5M53_03585 [Candidatus Cloacimonas sp. 4484_209]
MKNDILTICVNYYNDEETASFLKELLAQQNYDDQKVIIVDNSNKLNDKSMLFKSFGSDKRVLIYHPGKNLGYFGGASWGLKQYLKEFSLPDWTIVCNTDIHFPDNNFFMRLLHFHADNPVAVITPTIISERSGRSQDIYMHMPKRPSRLRMHFYKWVSRYYFILITYQILSLLKERIGDQLKQSLTQIDSTIQSGNKPVKVYAPSGVFAIFHRSYFEAGGNLNHGVFLFGEEIFVAETARRLHLTVLHDPKLKIVHKGHSTTNIIKSPQIAHFIRESAAYCANTFF